MTHRPRANQAYHAHQAERPAATPLALAAVLLVASLAVGCTSDNTHEFQSKVYQPITITLTDPVRGQELWTYDVPTQHMLVLDYNRRLQSGWGNEAELFGVKNIPPTHMKWKLYKGFGKDVDRQIAKGKLELPGTPVYMQMTLRPTPELPPDDQPTLPANTVDREPFDREVVGEDLPPVVYEPESPDTQPKDTDTNTDAAEAQIDSESEPAPQTAPATQPE